MHSVAHIYSGPARRSSARQALTPSKDDDPCPRLTAYLTRITPAPVSETLPTLQPGLRALMQFDTLPAGHKTLITDDGSAPHLNEREYAVVDVTEPRTEPRRAFCDRVQQRV